MRFSGETETRMKRARDASHARGVGTPLKIIFLALPLLRYLLFVLAARLSPIACKTHKIYGFLQVILDWGGREEVPNLIGRNETEVTTCDKSGWLKW